MTYEFGRNVSCEQSIVSPHYVDVNVKCNCNCTVLIHLKLLALHGLWGCNAPSSVVDSGTV